MKWLEWAWSRDEICDFTPASLLHAGDLRKVVISTHRICDRAKKAGRPWEDVKEDLEDFHAALAAAKTEWA